MQNKSRNKDGRKASNRELNKRLKMEKLLIEISSKAMSCTESSEFQQICLKAMGAALQVSRVYIFQHLHATDTMDNTFEWTKRGIAPQKDLLQGIAAKAVPWWIKQMKANKVINFEDIEQIPSEPEKAILRIQQIKSILVVPMYVYKQYYGFIGFDACRKKRRWQDEDVNILLAITRIMTGFIERIQSDRDLAESEHKYRQLFEMESDAIFLIDNAAGNLLEANSACESLYGYSRRELLEMKNTNLSAEPGETRKATLDGLANVPLRYHRKKDGTVFPVEITARHFSWQGREVHVAAIRDIAWRIEAEQRKEDLEAQLRQAQKMDSIGTLAGGIAHDFNNILSAIMGYTELAMMDKNLSVETLEELNEVMHASLRAKKLVAQILAFSRQSQSEFGPTPISLIVKETLGMLRATLPAFIEIDLELETDAVVMADANQIQQVVMNLCTNAYHAMKDRGGRLHIGLSESLVDEDRSRRLHLAPGRYLKLVVADTGTGMEPHTMQRAFEPYFTTKEKGQGTGLGLSVAYGIVKTHKGTITLKSELAKGSTFSVYLPQLVSQYFKPSVQIETVIPGGHERVLCVDDDPELARMVKTMLDRAGYQVTHVSSAPDALELFKLASDQFDLILTDLNMPHLPGNVLASQINQIRPDVPIILCTGFSDPLTEQQLAATGIRAVALKPLLMADLAKLIRGVLDGCRVNT
jgi:PAS domain S-box-containing protein